MYMCGVVAVNLGGSAAYLGSCLCTCHPIWFHPTANQRRGTPVSPVSFSCPQISSIFARG